METVLPGVHATAPHALPFAPSLEIRSFLLRRDEGNLLIYGSPMGTGDAEEARRLGGVRRRYLNHWHEAAFGCGQGADALGAPLLCHRDDAARTAESCRVHETFAQRAALDADFEIVPTPGHTPGATAYLWSSGEHRCLFTGDTVYLDGGEWVAGLLESSDREQLIGSLELMATLDFDVLIPWAATRGGPCLAVSGGPDARRRLEAIITRLRRGEGR